MKYMLIMNTPRDGYAQYMKWPRKILEANAAFMQAFSQKLATDGELIGAEGLASPTEAKCVRATRDGTPITDGVFPESKEFLAGYWIVDVESPERAYQLAAEMMAAPHGPVTNADGGPFEFGIEVRAIMSGRHDIA
jgi:hypothetical protein